MTRNVLIIQRRLPQYRTALFDRLRERLAKNDVQLSLVHGSPSPDDYLKKDIAFLPWAEQVTSRHIRFGKTESVYMSLPWNLIGTQDLVIMPHENGMLANFLLLGRQFAGSGNKLAFFGHGRNFQSTVNGKMKERLRRNLIPLVDWWFAYTELSVREIEATGFSHYKITCLNNAIDTAALREMAAGITIEERTSLLRSLGLKGTHCAVFLGSLYENKRLVFLFDAADKLLERIPDFELLIIGDGPQRDEVGKLVKLRSWARWVGVRFGRDKVLHASLGSVMLNPGLVGLGILDSFSLGLPIITTDCGIHSPEIAYLDNRENGIMTKDSLAAFVEAAADLLKDQTGLAAMRRQCLEDAARYSLENMIENFAKGIEAALDLGQQAVATEEQTARDLHIAIIWQRFLPYHRARLIQLKKALTERGYTLTAIEVASQDVTYGFPEGEMAEGSWITCFPGGVYHHFTAEAIHERVLTMLNELKPDIVFAPATPFPEGMAAIAYRDAAGAKVILMDDAWEVSDHRGPLTRLAKRIIHSHVDGTFIPALSHRKYYADLNIPSDRMVFGVDVVDNDYYATGTEALRRSREDPGHKTDLPQSYFLFVGRFIERKGINTLLDAYRTYRTLQTNSPWDLVLAGDGPAMEMMQRRASGISGIRFVGRRFGHELLVCYAFAKTLIVPSEREPWALVVNEGMAAGLPVIVSRGCGSAQTLVREADNGWTFKPNDSAALARLMEQMSNLPDSQLGAMGEKSRKIISEWSLIRFCQGVMEAINIPRRDEAGLLSNLAVRFWKGRVTLN